MLPEEEPADDPLVGLGDAAPAPRVDVIHEPSIVTSDRYAEGQCSCGEWSERLTSDNPYRAMASAFARHLADDLDDDEEV